MVGDGVEPSRRSIATNRTSCSGYPDAGTERTRCGALASNRCHVAFITAYDEYAVAAFEQGAVDYVLKPFTAARLATTVGRLKERCLPPPDLSELLVRLSGIANQGSYCGGSTHRWARE